MKVVRDTENNIYLEIEKKDIKSAMEQHCKNFLTQTFSKKSIIGKRFLEVEKKGVCSPPSSPKRRVK